MSRSRFAALTCGLLLAPTLAFAQPVPDVSTAARLRDRALQDRTAYELVSSLTTEIGPRPGGSPAFARAADWAMRRLRALGFENVHQETFALPVWTRGEERAEIVGAYAQPLHITALGGSVATPAAGMEAELAVFPAYQDLLDAPVGSLRGRIAVVLQPMPRAQDGSGYGATGVVRRSGASEAARRGAVAYLMRSLGTDDSRSPHTGVMRYAEDAPRIPAAALSTVDADQIGRLAALNRPLRARLLLTPTLNPNGQTTNVVGELRGRSAREGGAPDEVILIGGHLDSWDLGTGAIDDGAGVAITTAAARMTRDAPRRPRRTIRVVLFGAEETGPAGDAYAAAHRDEVGRIVLTSESDFGADRIWRAALPAGTQQTPWGRAVAQALIPLRVVTRAEAAGHAGSDVGPLQELGVPAFELDQDGLRYFDWHHTAEDTLDKIDPEQLAQNVAVWTTVLWLAADSNLDFRAAAPPAAPAAPH